jgi:hypothetical protein
MEAEFGIRADSLVMLVVLSTPVKAERMLA